MRLEEGIGIVRAAGESAKLDEIVARLRNAYAPERIYLFGSHARGEAGPDSDLDILVVVNDDAPADRRVSRLAYQALRGTGVAADVLVWTRSYFEGRRHLRASLSATVASEGRLLYAA
jgi:predicted nucleotidyltransferase